MKAICRLLLLFLCACSSEEPRVGEAGTGEFIHRKRGEYHFKPNPSVKREGETYPWQEGVSYGKFPKITKEYFRCKGSPFNPVKSEVRNGETLLFRDCGGSDKHSLPLIHGKEGVYPILIDLLNWVQNKTQKRVVITAGHRCPDHNLYVDPSPRNQSSKHMIGGEVSFYVQGLEERPEVVVKLIQDYYLQDPSTRQDKKYTEFKRYEKEDTGVSTPPWMNHEIFIKLYQKKEGRNFDNRHPYPYLSLQVRTDRATGERIIYAWDKAYNNFLRY